jgi:hypothetical protein
MRGQTSITVRNRRPSSSSVRAPVPPAPDGCVLGRAALPGATPQTCLMLGERLQALRCEPGELGELSMAISDKIFRRTRNIY